MHFFDSRGMRRDSREKQRSSGNIAVSTVFKLFQLLPDETVWCRCSSCATEASRSSLWLLTEDRDTGAVVAGWTACRRALPAGMPHHRHTQVKEERHTDTHPLHSITILLFAGMQKFVREASFPGKGERSFHWRACSQRRRLCREPRHMTKSALILSVL